MWFVLRSMLTHGGRARHDCPYGGSFMRGRMAGMPKQSEIPRRHGWPRFSLRMLLIVLTIACLYLGCWFPTATTGVRDIYERYSAQTKPKAPLLLVLEFE